MKNFVGWLMLLCIAVFSCTTKTEVYESQMNREFKNGQTIFVKKTDEVSRLVGRISGHLWNERHTFRYQFTTEPDEVEWQGLLGEVPKSVLYCNTELYLKTTTEHVVTDTIRQITSTIAEPNYYRHVDKRYFFKLFGDQYFVMIDSVVYQTKTAACSEEYVPKM
jgi:hypothetical protein